MEYEIRSLSYVLMYLLGILYSNTLLMAVKFE